MGEGRRGDDHRIEIDLVQSLFQRGKTGIDAELIAGLIEDGLCRVHQGHDPGIGQVPLDILAMQLTDAASADHTNLGDTHRFLHVIFVE